MGKFIIQALLVNAVLLGSGTAGAQGILGSVGQAIGNAVGGDVGKAITGVSNAGDDVSRNLQQGNIAGTVQAAGSAIVSAGQVQGGAINDIARATGNRDVTNVAGAYASVVTLNSDALGTATIVSGNVLAGQDPRQVYAGPLATAIRQARNAHLHGARPIPGSIREALRGVIPDHILDNARYTEGNLEISIANVINRSNRAMGDDFAVAVGDLIVFTQTPSADPEDAESLLWWAHELAHLWQYDRWGGIEQFAVAYIDNSGAVENDADQVANGAVEWYSAL